MTQTNFDAVRPTVVCLHSSGANGGQWKALRNSAGHRYDLVTPNLIGYGATAFDPFADLSFDDEIAAVLDSIGSSVDQFHLVGHSYGGAVATQLALRHPERVASLTLYEPVLFTLLWEDGANTPAFREVRKIAETLSDGIDTIHGRWRGARDFVNYWSGSDVWSSFTDRQHGRLAELTPKIEAEFRALLASGFVQNDLAALALPVRLMCGTATRRSTRRVAEVFADGPAVVEFDLLDGLGHMAPITAPGIINPLIIEHVERSRTIAEGDETRWRSGGDQALCLSDNGESGRLRHGL